MVWLILAVSIPLLLLLCLHFLRFHFLIEIETPKTAKGSAGVTFFGFKREFAVDAGRFLSGDEAEAAEESWDAEDHLDPSLQGQRGGVGLPDSWLRGLARFKRRLRDSSRKWMLDFGVWRALLRYALKSGRRVLGLLKPALEFFHLGMEDVYALGRIAGAWSALTGMLPFLSCPVEFAFCEKPFRLRVRLGGRFSALSLIGFLLLSLFSFPWRILLGRFLHCWRNPRLARWQKRVLLP